MRYSASEKQEIIDIVVRSEIGVNKTLKEIGLNKSTFYNWYKVYSEEGIDGLAPSKRTSNKQWNSIPRRKESDCRISFGLSSFVLEGTCL